MKTGLNTEVIAFRAFKELGKGEIEIQIFRWGLLGLWKAAHTF